MIEINLIPDIKAEFLKAQKTTRMVMAGAIAASVGAIILTMALYSYANIQQAGHLKNLNNDIESGLSQLSSIEGIVEVLTVNKQLETLPELHAEKPAAERLKDYLSKTVPTNVSLTEITVDFERNEISIAGKGYASTQLEAAKVVNGYIDILKNAQYVVLEADQTEVTEQTGEQQESESISEESTESETANQENAQAAVAAFAGIILETISGNDADDGIGQEKVFEIRMNFDPELFNQSRNIELQVPNTNSDQTGFKRIETLFTPGEGVE